MVDLSLRVPEVREKLARLRTQMVARQVDVLVTTQLPNITRAALWPTFRAKSWRAQEQTMIEEQQAFAWNPSVRGAKSEDTILLTSAGVSILTQTDGWPVWPISIGEQTILRPAILESV